MATAWDITGDEIQTWALRFDAAGKLPDLVRRLLLATAPLGTIEMRADGGVYLGGWDGIVYAHRGTPHCPQGASVWELTIRRASRAKLDEDFEKRRKDAPSGVIAGDVAYVVVTAQRFEDKAAWAAERAKAGVFKSVRVLDADDLAIWLTQAPAVARWFGSMVGKPAVDLFDLEGFAAEWSGRTSPPLPFELLLAGREREKAAELVRAWPQPGRPSPLRVRADTKEEAIAFVAAALDLAPSPQREQFLARTLVVESRDALRWAQRGGAGEPTLILPHYDDFEPRDAARNSYVVLALDVRTLPGQNEIRLGAVPHRRVAEILARAGIPEAEARRRAEESGGKLTDLQRLYGYAAPPAWAERFDRTLLSVLLLAGAWQPDNEADREVIQALGADPADLRKLCEELSVVPDAATVKDVARWGPVTWTFQAPGAIWQELVGRLPGEVLHRFQGVVPEVLGKTDPRYELAQDERFAATVRGEVLKESAGLREGLVRSLARLAQSDAQLDALHGPGAGSRVATISVRRVLKPAWIRWASASHLLPLLAEAAPEAFLDQLEESLDKGDDGAEHLLAEEGRSGSPHTGLLWALETLGWSQELMPRVARALARLARQDKDADQPGRLSNRPARSLQQLLRPLFAETLAPAESQLSVLRGLLSATPDVAYPLLLRFLGRGIAMWYPHRRPEFLPWAIDDEEHQDRGEKEADHALVAVMTLALEHAADDAGRWAPLLSAACHPGGDDEISRCLLNRLDERKEHIRDEKAAIWTALRDDCIARTMREGRTHPNFVHALELYESFTPPDPIQSIAWLFRQDVQPPDVSVETDGQERARIVTARRIEALRHLPEREEERLGILKGLLATDVDRDILGSSIGQANLAWDLDASLFDGEIDIAVAPLLAPYFVSRYFAREDRDEWTAATFRRLIADGRSADVVLIAQRIMGHAFWDLLDALGDPIRAEYWRSLHLVLDFEGAGLDYWERAVRCLLDVGNISVAVAAMVYKPDYVSDTLVIRALSAFAASPDEQKRFFSMPMTGSYTLTRLIARAEKIDPAPIDLLEAMELIYSLIAHQRTRPLKYLSAAFTRNPEYFLDKVKALYDREDRQAQADEAPSAERREQAKAAHRILEAWYGFPGEGSPPEAAERILHDWSATVLRRAAEEGRAYAGTVEVAKVLSRAPAAADNHWPCEAARKLLEAGVNPDLAISLRIAKFNLRGMTTRAIGEGGKQEHTLAAQFGGSAEALRSAWPRTAAMLLGLSERYKQDATTMDAEAAATLRRVGAEPEDFERPKSPPPPSPRRAIVAEGVVHVTSIELRELCAFESLTVTFPLPADGKGQWIVLLGENGTGKTSLLRGIALAVGGPIIAQDALGKVPAGLVRQEKIEANCVVEGPGVRYAMTIGALPREHVARSTPENGTPRPLLFGYGCRRGSALGGPEPTRVEAQSSDVATLFDERERVLPTRGWLKDLWALAGDRTHDPDRVHQNVYDQIRAKLCRLLPDEKTRIEVDAGEVWVTSADVGGRVPLAALSDGYLTTLGWAADLVQRWLSWAERRGVTPAGDFFAEQMEGLVLLDEVDLHLHPQWQRQIIRKIREVFPRMSFVVTTHNPLTLLGAAASEIWVLRRDEGGIVAEQGHGSPALMTSSQLYAGYFGITSLFPNELGDKLRRYGFLAGTPARTDVEEKEVHRLRDELKRAGVDPGWEPVAREEPPPFPEDEEAARP